MRRAAYDEISDVDQAKYEVVHDFPGGAARLAPLVAMRPGTLSNKVNPFQESHHLTVDEAIALQHATQDYRIFYAEARALGHVTVPVGDYAATSDVELLNAYAAFHREVGETAKEIQRALADRRITTAELTAIRREMFEDWQRELELLNRLEALCEDA
jgi:hypothetical protein